MAEWEAIHRIADRLTPELRRAFLEAVAQLRTSVSVEALAIALQTGRVAAVEFVLDPTRFAAELLPAVAVVNEAFAKAGDVAARTLGPQLGEVVAFDRTNEFAVRAVDRVSARMIKGLTEDAAAGIDAIVKRGFSQGFPPRDMARMMRDLVGLSAADQQAVINYRFGLLKQGLTGDRVERLVQVYAQKKLRERALTIARTMTIDASAEGQLELWRQARRRGLIQDAFKVWIVTPDDRLCRRCRALDGQKRRLEEPFLTAFGPRQRPTLHPRCRCALGLVFKAQPLQRAA